MVTEKNKQLLNNLVANLSFNDFWNINKNSTRARLGQYTPKGKERKWNSYSLSVETLDALRVRNLATLNEVPKRVEEEAKALLLKYAFTNEKILLDNHEYIKQVTKQENG